MEKIINRISKKAMHGYNIACKHAEKFTKEMKLRSKMSENKRKIQEIYEDIGKYVYETHILDKNSIDKNLDNNCSMIDILADENEDIRMEILKLKDLKQCPECHYEIYCDFHFCPNCGHTQESPKEDQYDGPATIVTTDEEDSNLKQ